MGDHFFSLLGLLAEEGYKCLETDMGKAAALFELAAAIQDENNQ